MSGGAIDPSAPLGTEFRRLAEFQIDATMTALSGADGSTGPHEARKQLKELRALLRLVRPADEAFFQRENVRYRDIAHALAGVRGAAALVETIDRFIRDFPGETAAGELAGVRRRLVAERDHLIASGSGFEKLAREAVADCRLGRAALDRLDLPERPIKEATLLANGMAKVARKADAARRRARRTDAAIEFHEMRKAVKQHWSHLRLLAKVWPEHRKRRVKATKRLGNRLGELHDIDVMRILIAKEPCRVGSPEEIALLEHLLERKEILLKRKSLKSAKRLFKAKPARLARRVRRNYFRTARRARKEQAAVAQTPSEVRFA